MFAEQNIYHSILDNLHLHVAVLDNRGAIIYTNRAWEDFARENGMEENAQCIGVNYLEICRQAQGAKEAKMARDVAAALQEMLEEKRETFALEYPCHSPVTERWFVLYAARVQEPGPASIILYHENVTRARQAENISRQEQENLKRFRLALDASADDIYLIDYETMRFIDVNETACRNMGYQCQELLAMGPQDIKPYVTEEELKKRFYSILSGNSSLQVIETEHQRKDGTRFPVEVHLRPVELNGRQLMVASVRDITLRKQIEEELQRSEQAKEIILSSMTERVVYHDPEMKIRWANRAAGSFYGVSPGQARGKRCFDLLQRSWDECEACPVKLAIETGEVQEATRSFLEGNTFLIRAYPVINAAGTLEGVVEVTMDVTDRVKYEQELAQARDRAQASDRAKTQFVANMSHEIRTPMNVIMGMTDLVLATGLLPEQREFMEMIKASSESLLNLINDILDISRIEEGKLELEQLSFDLVETVEKTIAFLSLPAHEKGLDLSYSIDRDLPANLLGDPFRLRQVLVNLVGNAIKFTEEGYVKLSISRAAMPTESGKNKQGQVNLHFSIADTGTGIPRDSLDLLFKSFTQIDGTMSRTHEGAGLGLAISKNLVQMMGGQIWVDSQPGHGSIFHFTAVFEEAEAPQAAQGEPETAAVSGPGQQGIQCQRSGGFSISEQLLNILLVEDKPMNRKLARVLLEKKGWKVTEAADGKEAVSVITLSPGRFDLILMDVQMPEMDGLEATRLIREQEQQEKKRTPVIAMTAHALKGDRERFLEAGMDNYISKPIQAEDLYSSVARVTGKVAQQEIGSCADENEANPGKEQPALPEDLDRMLNQVAGDTSLLEELFTLFLEDSRQDIPLLKKSVEQKDPEEIVRLAHGLKGELGNLGVRKAAELARQMEKQAKEGDLENITGTIGQLEQEIQFLKHFFSRPDWKEQIQDG